jgi:hypothetical protein
MRFGRWKLKIVAADEQANNACCNDDQWDWARWQASQTWEILYVPYTNSLSLIRLKKKSSSAVFLFY